jgi:phenylpropionate dioxygenase-like ring-hydroxylating dioxygenase large terminal subunit
VSNGTPPAAEQLVRQLVAAAALPLERAQTLAPEWYWRADLYDLEVERIFRKEWMCVARADPLSRAGYSRGLDLAGEPVLLTRDEHGDLHALSRVCRHRSIDLLAGAAARGTFNRIVCPYHLWSYKLNGQLAGAPEMQDAKGFERTACRLPEFRLETWQGFVFVNLDPRAAPLAPRLAGVEEILAGRDLSDWRTLATVDWGEVGVNWKIVIENASECYHHMGTHRLSLQPLWPANSVRVDHIRSPDWYYGTMTSSDALAEGHEDGYPIHPTFLPVPPGLTPQQRSATLIVGVFPMFFFALSPDFCTWFRWYPSGPMSHFVDIHVVVPPTTLSLPGLGEVTAQIAESIRGIQAEDTEANVGVQRGCRASAAAPGRLSRLEQPLWQFQRYLAGRLSGAIPRLEPGAPLD